MKVKTILAKAKRAKTDEDSVAILETLHGAFGKTKELGWLGTYNNEAYLEGGNPFVQFELNRIISDDYITMVRPAVRDGAMTVEVMTNHMKDGKGMFSTSWEVALDLEDILEADEDQTIQSLAQRAKEIAIHHHSMLIESVGVNFALARQTAEASW